MNHANVRGTVSKRYAKLTILWVLRALGLFWLGRMLTQHTLTIVGWHGVSTLDEHARFPELFISQQSLRRRLEFLKKHFRIIDMDEALRQKDSGDFQPRQVVLTFDDGYLNFKTMAAPLLRQFGMVAVVYVVSERMKDPEARYEFITRDMILSAQSNLGRVCVPGIGELGPFDAWNSRRQSLARALEALNKLPREGECRLNLVHAIGKALQMDVDSKRRAWFSLDTHAIRSLSDQGFSIQPHSDTHRPVGQCLETIYQEARVSSERVAEVTGKSARHYCYPSGLWHHGAWDPLSRAGIVSAVTCCPGPNFPQTPVLGLRRYIDGECASQLEFEFALSNLRWLASVLLHPRYFYVSQEVPVELVGDSF